MSDISLLLAFSAGLLSFLSPCVLPLVPAYIGYLAGSNTSSPPPYANTSITLKKDKSKKFYTLYKSFGFVIGFSLIFILMGVSITSLGKLITTNKSLIRKLGGLIVIIFGIHTTGILKIKFLYYEKRFLSFNFSGNFSSILMGIAFAAGWTPCIGPILSTILIYASNMDTIKRGILLLIMYSLGLAIPFILTAYAMDEIRKYIKNFYKYMTYISLISGILMLIMGILIFTNNLTTLSQYFYF